jgi:hypothetical protein
MFFPVRIGEQLYLLPASWTHVIEAFNAMQRYGSKIRPCPLTAASVFLNAASKMSVSALHAVMSFQTINFMKDLWAYDQTLKPDSSARAFSSDPSGTIAYMEMVTELVTIMHHGKGAHSYYTPDDWRLERASRIAVEMRIVTQQLTQLWPTRKDWLVYSETEVKYARQCFVSAEALSALDNAVAGFRAFLPQVLRLCPKVATMGVRWVTTGTLARLVTCRGAWQHIPKRLNECVPMSTFTHSQTKSSTCSPESVAHHRTVTRRRWTPNASSVALRHPRSSTRPVVRSMVSATRRTWVLECTRTR